MHIRSNRRRREQGSSLLTVVVVGAVMCITTCSMLVMSTNSINNAYGRVSWEKAFYCAENAMVWAAQSTFDNSVAPGSTNFYSTALGTLPIGSIIAPTNGDSTFMGAWVTVAQPSSSASNVCIITASACVNNKVRTLQSQITVRPISQVFDYEYFLNNWGWWWGSTITGNGGQRANWDFDFRDGPTVNGSIYSADQVDENEIPIQDYAKAPFGGTAGADVTNFVHQGAPRVTMPNLLNFSNYIATAMANTSSNGLWVGTNQLWRVCCPTLTLPIRAATRAIYPLKRACMWWALPARPWSLKEQWSFRATLSSREPSRDRAPCMSGGTFTSPGTSLMPMARISA